MNLPLNSPLDHSNPIEHARYNMVQQQIRPWNVSNEAVLDALSTVRREDFVPEAYRDLAFADLSIPLVPEAIKPTAPEGHTRSMFPPRVDARMLNDLQIQPHERVLEIGTGTGYSAALLSRLAREVVTLEIDAEQAEIARSNLAAAGCANVRVIHQCGADPEKLPQEHFDVIILSGSVASFPIALIRKLPKGGRLGLVVGDMPVMRYCVITDEGDGITDQRPLWETVLPRLQNFALPSRFKF